jgi:hypothetical protein
MLINVRKIFLEKQDKNNPVNDLKGTKPSQDKGQGK